MTPQPMMQVETLKSVVLDNAKTGYKFEIRIGASPARPDLVVWCYPFEHVDVQKDWDADPHLGKPVPGYSHRHGYDEVPTHLKSYRLEGYGQRQDEPFRVGRKGAIHPVGSWIVSQDLARESLHPALLEHFDADAKAAIEARKQTRGSGILVLSDEREVLSYLLSEVRARADLMLEAYPPMRDSLANKLAHDVDEWRDRVRDRDRLLEDVEEMLEGV